MEKGYILTWDALISISLVLFIMVGFIGLHYFRVSKAEKAAFQKAHNVVEDSVETLSKKGVLEEIGFLYTSGNLSEAANLSRLYLDQLVPPNMGYRIEFVDGGVTHVIYDSGDSRIAEAEVRDVTRASRIISGYREDAPREGWVARAWLVENYSWRINTICRDSGCLLPVEELNLTYYPPSIVQDIFYIRVPLDVHVAYVVFNVSWNESGPVPTTTSVTTSTVTSTSFTTTSASSTSSTLWHCHDCPPLNSGCEIEVNRTRTYYTQGDEYNYHFFDIPAGSMCDVELHMQPSIDSDYDMYVNWTPDFCPTIKEGLMPYDWDEFNCPENPTDLGFLGEPETCLKVALGAGRYHVMVDCYNESFFGREYCPGGYTITVNLFGPFCVITPSTTLMTSTTGTTVTTTSHTTTSSSSSSTLGCWGYCLSNSGYRGLVFTGGTCENIADKGADCFSGSGLDPLFCDVNYNHCCEGLTEPECNCLDDCIDWCGLGNVNWCDWITCDCISGPNYCDAVACGGDFNLGEDDDCFADSETCCCFIAGVTSTTSMSTTSSSTVTSTSIPAAGSDVLLTYFIEDNTGLTGANLWLGEISGPMSNRGSVPYETGENNVLVEDVASGTYQWNIELLPSGSFLYGVNQVFSVP